MRALKKRNITRWAGKSFNLQGFSYESHSHFNLTTVFMEDSMTETLSRKGYHEN